MAGEEKRGECRGSSDRTDPSDPSDERSGTRNMSAEKENLRSAVAGFQTLETGRPVSSRLGQTTRFVFQCLGNGFDSARPGRDATRVARRFSAGNRATHAESPVGTKEMLLRGWTRAGFAGLESPAHEEKCCSSGPASWERRHSRLRPSTSPGQACRRRTNAAREPLRVVGAGFFVTDVAGVGWARGAGSPAHEEDVRADVPAVAAVPPRRDRRRRSQTAATGLPAEALCRPGLRPGAPGRSMNIEHRTSNIQRRTSKHRAFLLERGRCGSE